MDKMKWHVWRIKQPKVDSILKDLEDIDNYEIEVVYPTKVISFYLKGKKIRKWVPLYSGYLFIKHDNSSEVQVLIKNVNGVSYHVGLCTEEDIRKMNKYHELNDSKRGIIEGDLVEILSGSLAKQQGIVKEIKGGSATISLSFFDRTVDCVVPSEDLVVLE